MNFPEYIKRRIDLRSDTIFRIPLSNLEQLLCDPDLSLDLKFTAVLGAFARLEFPLRIGDFRACIPSAFWAEHMRFGYRPSFGTHVVPIFWRSPETYYFIGIGPEQSRYHYRLCSVFFVADSGLVSNRALFRGGTFEPPWETPVTRFTLCHPFLEAEMHDPSGIYLFKRR